MDYSHDAARVSHCKIKAFLLDRGQVSLRLDRLTRGQRYAVHQALNGIDVEHNTVQRFAGDLGTMVVTKKNTTVRVASEQRKELQDWKCRLEEALAAVKALTHSKRPKT